MFTLLIVMADVRRVKSSGSKYSENAKRHQFTTSPESVDGINLPRGTKVGVLPLSAFCYASPRNSRHGFLLSNARIARKKGHDSKQELIVFLQDPSRGVRLIL